MELYGPFLMITIKIHTKRKGDFFLENTLVTEYKQLLEDLQAASFVMQELTLYLDTHPKDQEAIEQYNQYSKYKDELLDYIEARFGPLKMHAKNPSQTKWIWANGPWPWQL